mgnify:CR=1 FL=1
MPKTVGVAVSNATFHFDKLYTYAVLPEQQDAVRLGSMVLVPFGRGSRARMGVVLACDAEPENAKLKCLFDVAPASACLTPELLALVHFLKERTFCTYYEAVKAVIPYGAQYKPTVAADGVTPVLQKQLVRHTENSYRLTGSLPQKPKPTAKQMAAVTLLSGGERTLTELEERGVSRAVLDNLCAKGVLECRKVNRSLDLYGDIPLQNRPLALTAEQQLAYEALRPSLEDHDPHAALLYGVTGSGKTQIYIRLIQEVLARGQTAMVLVPEISLTPQLLRVFASHFGELVAVLHSSLRSGERYDEWKRVRSGQARVVIGTRSAVFAPLRNLGLLILDEEQESTYKSENVPKYHARDVAKYRCAQNDALLVLGSATPSVESMYHAKRGDYRLFTLRRRYNEQALPEVLIADMKKELRAGNGTSLSGPLRAGLAAAMEAGEQSILFLNRRGASRMVTCGECGEVPTCPRCSVHLTYHSANGRLMCHYCGHSEPLPDACPSCGGALNFLGYGTQKVEEELHAAFPGREILRMDTDTVSATQSHEKLLSRFEKERIPVLVGTQMVAKGLDFEAVTLVGVLGVDSLLFAQGFRAYERVFSLITQVVGRSGRASDPGFALIQTTDPSNPVLSLAAAQDYDAFFEQEIAYRRLGLYPPFCSVCVVGFAGGQEAQVGAAAARFAVLLAKLAAQRPGLPLRVLGPTPAGILKINETYRYKLTLKCRNDRAFRDLMRAALAAYEQEKLPAKATVTVDLHADGDI